MPHFTTVVAAMPLTVETCNHRGPDVVDSGGVLLCPSCYQPEHPSDHSWLRFERSGRWPWSKPRITDIHGREVPAKPVLDVEFTNILNPP